MDRRYIFVVNPSSGAGKGEVIAGLLQKLLPEHPRLGGGGAEVLLTNRIEASELTEKLSHFDAAIAVGGDGTVSRLAAHLLECENPPALGLIPLGTSNDLARTLGISVTADYASAEILGYALDGILNAKAEKLDIFSVNETLLFCNYFSIGFDAAVVRDFDAVRGSRSSGALPAGRFTNNMLYFLMGLKNLFFRLPPTIEIAMAKDGGDRKLKLDSPCRAIILSSLPIYAGGCRISPDAKKGDGAFEITVVHNIYEYATLILSRFLPFLDPAKRLESYKAENATVRLQSPAPSQIDGEKCSEADVPAPILRISFRNNLQVLTPRVSL